MYAEIIAVCVQLARGRPARCAARNGTHNRLIALDTAPTQTVFLFVRNSRRYFKI